MHSISQFGQGLGSVYMDPSMFDPVEAARLLEAQAGSDVIDISVQARAAFERAGQQDLFRHALSLPQMQERIETVRSEISTLWNSALPDKEKFRLISAKENEIALLQAGQFNFARAGFSFVA